MTEIRKCDSAASKRLVREGQPPAFAWLTQPKLVVEVVEVKLHRRLADVEPGRDLGDGGWATKGDRLVDERPAQLDEHLALSSCDRRRRLTTNGRPLRFTFGDGAEDKQRRPHPDLVPWLQWPIADETLAVKERAIGRTEITEHETAAVALEG